MPRRLMAGLMILFLILSSLGAALAEPPAGTCSGADAVRNNYQHFWSISGDSVATCTQPGTRTYQCTYCGQQYTEIYAQPLGHTLVKTGGTEATCVTPGTVTYTCAVCGATVTETAPATGVHTYGDWIVDERATCKNPELQRRTCSGCGNVEWRYVGFVQPHTWGEWVTVTAPTAVTPGLRERTCTVCGTKEQGEIPASAPAAPAAPASVHPALTLEAVSGSGSYGLGDVIPIDYTLTNTGDTALTFVQADGVDGIALPEHLGVGELYMWNGSHTVTQADVDNAFRSADGTAMLILPAIIRYAAVDGGQTVPAEGECFLSFQISLYSGADLPVSEKAPPEFKVEITAPAGAGFGVKAGDTIDLTVTRTNNGTGSVSEMEIDLQSDTVYAAGEVTGLDNFQEWRNYIYPIKAAESKPYTHTVTVQPEDISQGFLYREIRISYAYDANGTDFDPLSATRAEAWSDKASILIGLTDTPVISPEDPETPETPVIPETPEGPETPEEPKTPETPGKDPEPSAASLVTVVKTVTSTSKTVEGYEPDENVVFEIAITNHTGGTLNSVAVYDVLSADSDPIGTISVLDGETVVCGFNYTVTDEDAENKNIANTASAVWRNPETGEEVTSTSNTVDVPVIERKPLTLRVEKSFVTEPKLKEGYVEGEEVVFRIRVINDSPSTVEGISVQDYLAVPTLGSSTIKEIASLAPGAYDETEWTYTVTAEDVNDRGYVTNVAYILYNDPTEDTVKALYSNVVMAFTCKPAEPEFPLIEPVVPGADPETDPDPDPEPAPEPEAPLIEPVVPEEAKPALTVEKTLETEPKNHFFFTDEETPVFRIKVTNSGNMKLTNVQVYESLEELDKGLIYFVPELEAGAFVEVEYKYVLADHLPLPGYLKNEATALGFTENGTEVTASSERVIIFCEMPPLNRVPETPAEPVVENSCRVILTGYADGAWEYALRVCDEHRGTLMRSGMHSEASMKGMDLDDWAEAAEYWRTAVQKEYARLGAEEDGNAFFALLDCEQTLLRTLYPDQPARVSEQLACQLMFRCVELCDIRSHPSAERLESVYSQYVKPLETPVVSGVGVDDEGRFIVTFSDDYAAAAAAGGNADAETWRSIRRAYVQAFDDILDSIDRSTGGTYTAQLTEAKTLANTMLESHEAFLSSRFPGHEDVNQQLLAQLAMRMLIRAVDLAE